VQQLAARAVTDAHANFVFRVDTQLENLVNTKVREFDSGQGKVK